MRNDQLSLRYLIQARRDANTQAFWGDWQEVMKYLLMFVNTIETAACSFERGALGLEDSGL